MRRGIEKLFVIVAIGAFQKDRAVEHLDIELDTHLGELRLHDGGHGGEGRLPGVGNQRVLEWVLLVKARLFQQGLGFSWIVRIHLGEILKPFGPWRQETPLWSSMT